MNCKQKYFFLSFLNSYFKHLPKNVRTLFLITSQCCYFYKEKKEHWLMSVESYAQKKNI